MFDGLIEIIKGMFDTPIEVVGQTFSIIAVILGFICFQMKSARAILIFQVIIALTFSVHYILIGEYAAAPVNAIAAVQSLCYYFRNKKGSKSLFMPIFFAVIMVVVNALSWVILGGGWYTVFLLLGVTVGAVSLSFSSDQNIRYAMLIKAPLCLVYNAISGSVGGVIYESSVLISSIVGILKNLKEKKHGKI